MQLIKKNFLTLAGILLGAIAGYFYWRLDGCTTGTCAITSSPVMSSLYGALMGGLVFNMFKKQTTDKR